MSKITPNKLKQAQAELPTTNLSGYSIPKEIDAKVAKEHYFMVGVRAKDTPDKMSKIYSFKDLCIHQNQWRKILRQVESGIFNKPFGNTFTKVVILHNPTIKAVEPVKEEKKAPSLSPSHKKKVKDMYSEGMEAVDIAAELEKDVALVEAYINEKLK